MTKFMYNGIKVDGKLYGAFYSFGKHIKSNTMISIFARSYEHFPQIGISITNNSDSQSDYFETDTMTIDIDSPMYKDVLKAAIKARIKNLDRYIKRNSKPNKYTNYVQIQIQDTTKEINTMQNLYNTL